MSNNQAIRPTSEPWIAPEGVPFILIGLIPSLLFFSLGWISLGTFGLMLTVATGLFFRNPRRFPVTDPRLLISPADGTIVAITEPSQETIRGQATRRISIFLSVFNVHINRYPCAGKITAVHYNPGKFFGAMYEKASLENEQQTTTLQTPSGKTVLVRQIAGWIARRIVCYAKPDEQAARGARMGLIRFGSRVDLFIPAEWSVLVQVGQKIKGGESVIALTEEKAL